MVKSSKEEIFNEDNKAKTKKIVGEIIEEPKKYLNIWKANPSFKDINNNLSYVKAFSILIISISIMISSYLLYGQLFSSISIGFLCALVFIFVFHDESYGLRYLFQFHFRSRVSFSPFQDFVFWYDKNQPAALYISNKKDLLHTALHVFQITVIPENVHSALSQFVKALSSRNIRLSYTYQIVQKPIIPLFQEDKSRETALKSSQSRLITIYFMVSCTIKGILTESKIDRIKYFIKKYSNNLKSNLVSNFHHFQAKFLLGDALVNAVRTFFIKKDLNEFKSKDKREILNGYSSFSILSKLILMCVLMLYFDYIFFSSGILFIFVIGFNLAFILAFVLIWWRSLLFQFTKRKLLHKEDLVVIDPFDGVVFYHIKEFPYSLFMHIDNKLLLGMKMVSLKYIYQSPFCLLGKFIETINYHKISFSYTLRNQPLEYYEVYKNGLKYINEKTRKYILWGVKTRIKDEADAEQWMGYRFGMWYSMLTMSINAYRYIDSIEHTFFRELEDDLIRQIDSLKGAFGINFQGYEIEDLHSRRLISGFLFSCLKHNKFRLNGTHLNYVMLQGTTMSPLTAIVDILKKGTTTKIAAEFNTPLYLENFITIGHTINTEVLEAEVPVGFTLEQLKNLLIVNGTSDNRDAICMKIISELIKTKVPSIIFDFNGNWSKLLTYFKDTQFEKDILYFKYRSAFILDPIKSDIPYDQNNADYLEYMLYAFGLALKKDERTVEMFRNILQRHPGMDLGAIRMSLQNQTDWEKSPISDTLLSLFSDFTQDDLNFFQDIQKDSIVAHNFIQDNKTVIIDLSVLQELNKKSFLAFVILAKIIHYVKFQHDFTKKMIIIPYLDIFFDSYYLDLKRNYDKVDIFLKPLVENDFGLIFTANQNHYLHSNFLLYFNNIMTLKTADNRDIGMLRNLMNLQELEGIGYYSRTRNQTYQIRYLKNIKDNEVLIRREDIDQPFPAYVDWEAVQNQIKLPYEEIVRFMANQGYDLKFTERKILERAKKTLFEIDLGHYFIYVEEVIKFLDEIKTIDQIGNLYKHKLKTHLKEIIYPKISKKTSKKEHIKRVRDELLNILIKHGYLVEDHPRRAGGSETLRTSYSVGGRYQEALDDYFKTKGRAQTDIDVEILEKATENLDLENLFQGESRKYVVPEKNLKNALVREFSDFNYEIFTIYSYINREDYENALKIEHSLIKTYLMNIYRHFYNVESVVIADLNAFLTVLGDIKGFPFSKRELIDYIDRYQVINLEGDNLESLSKEMYQFIYNFFIKIQHYIYEENENDE